MARPVNALSLVASSGLTTTTGADLDNLGFSSALFVIDITSLVGSSPTATFTIQGKDAISGKYYTILASTALASTGTTVLRVSPYIAASANAVAQDFLPPFWRVNVARGGSSVSDLTCTVGVQLVNG